MGDWLLNAALGWIMAYPPVAAVVAIALVWAGSVLAISKSGMVVALFFRPIVKWTPTKKDDKYLEIVIYWLDVMEDVLDPLVLARWRQSWAVIQRVREDLDLAYSQRRRD